MAEFNRVEQRIRPQRLGMAVGHILLWGAEQQARVDDMILKNAQMNPYWERGAIRDSLSLDVWLQDERKKQETKLALRRFDARNLLSLNMRMHVRDQQSYIILTGTIEDINLRSATIFMSNPSVDKITNITYAVAVPFPEQLQEQGLQQSYFGHHLIVSFDVISTPSTIGKSL